MNTKDADGRPIHFLTTAVQVSDQTGTVCGCGHTDCRGQFPPDQQIASVTADGAFDTRKCHDAIAARSAAAIIPPRKKAKPWKPDTPGAIVRNDALRASRRFGRTICRRWRGYHRQSRVEMKMHCLKLLGQRLVARDFDRQVAQFQIRVTVQNGFTARDIPDTQTAR